MSENAISKREQREPLDHARDVLGLGALRAQEFAARGHIEEQVANLDARADRMRGRLGRADLAIVGRDRIRVRGAGLARGQLDARHGRDARQRFAAKAERADALEVVDRRDLAGRVPGEREQQLVALDADAVVAHAAQPHAALFDLDFDRRAPASMLFSISSLSTDAGRSTTSPAAI